MLYAQLFIISEEGNYYPKSDRMLIDAKLKGLLQEPENCIWEYFECSHKETALTEGLTLTDFNGNF